MQTITEANRAHRHSLLNEIAMPIIYNSKYVRGLIKRLDGDSIKSITYSSTVRANQVAGHQLLLKKKTNKQNTKDKRGNWSRINKKMRSQPSLFTNNLSEEELKLR